MKTVIEMAEEAGATHYWHLSRLERFAELVRADERESCAKVCDDFAAHYWSKDDAIESVIYEECATAIRARGQA